MNLSLFFVAAITVIVMPGSNTIYVVSRTIERGVRHGLYAALAIGLGSLLYALMVALGLGAIIARRPDVLLGVQLLGAGYLLYLGIRALRTLSSGDDGQQQLHTAGGQHTFGEALTVCLLNPKVVVFLLAFLPQFVTDAAGSYRMGLAILGTLFALLGTIWASALAVGTGILGSSLKHWKLPPWVAPAVSGSLLVGLALLAVLNVLV
jgi:threonine/homoserine/homoserine lactone efflux protein